MGKRGALKLPAGQESGMLPGKIEVHNPARVPNSGFASASVKGKGRAQLRSYKRLTRTQQQCKKPQCLTLLVSSFEGHASHVV